jgi:hypothetical protein
MSHDMAPEKIYRSPYPDVQIPEISTWHLIFDNPNRPRADDDKVIYVDPLTDKQLK